MTRTDAGTSSQAHHRIDTAIQKEVEVMGWLSGNWLWIVLIGGMLFMHLRHGGHGGMHGGHGGQARDEHGDHDHGAAVSSETDTTQTGHGHGGC